MSYNQPITIIQGMDKRAALEKKRKALFNKPVQLHTVGYCGACKTRYEGNHQGHEC